jgi:hypothetical protein
MNWPAAIAIRNVVPTINARRARVGLDLIAAIPLASFGFPSTRAFNRVSAGIVDSLGNFGICISASRTEYVRRNLAGEKGEDVAHAGR